jgi:SAM-dependent methyltransferase
MTGGFEEEWRHRFERYARRHTDDHRVSGWSEIGLRRRTAVFHELLDGGLLAPRSRVLDLGCGAGTYVRLLAGRQHHVVGVDYSLPSLGRAARTGAGDGARFVNAEAYWLPFGPAAFDAVVCIGVFQALREPARAMAEIARVLRPDGVLLVEVLNAWSPPAVLRRSVDRLRGHPGHLQYQAPRAMRRAAARHGFRSIRSVSILLPPRSLPALERALAPPWVRTALETLPGIRHVAAHAVWLIVEKG